MSNWRPSIRARRTKRLRWRLGLSDEQARKVQAILIKREKALTVIFHDIRPRLEEELKRTRDEVAAVLNPEQAKTWRRHFDDMQHRWFPGMNRQQRSGPNKNSPDNLADPK